MGNLMTCSFDIQLGNNTMHYFTQSLGLKETDMYVIPTDLFLEYSFVFKGYHSREWTKGGLLD